MESAYVPRNKSFCEFFLGIENAPHAVLESPRFQSRIPDHPKTIEAFEDDGSVRVAKILDAHVVGDVIVLVKISDGDDPSLAFLHEKIIFSLGFKMLLQVNALEGELLSVRVGHCP